jgi:hypothetical protein
MKVVHSMLIVMSGLVFAASCCDISVSAADNKESAISGQTQSGKPKPRAKKSNRIEFENAVLKMIVMPRTREQMKAFYEGRGFAPQAIDAIAKACFLTVIVKNKTKDVLWLELNNWRTNGGSSQVKRLNRQYWRQQWEALQVPMANRSTFSWTLLPEQRDLRADEGVGGNITVVFSNKPFELEARFFQGKDKQGGPVSVHMDGIQCRQ